MSTESTPSAKPSYKETLNLPKTQFSMEAKLVQNEPARLAKWREMGLYERLMELRAGAKKWVLHDGPPFANGDIHIGHLINKTLKDVLVKYHSMKGERCAYVPGWDCHGLPIEHKIQEELGSKLREMGVEEVRQKCFDYAARYAAVQSEQFQRLGILGDWGRPYMTMAPEYEASTLEVFAKVVEAGLVYKKLKPVPWSISNRTALAEAELEYKDVDDMSVYVEFLAERAGAAVDAFGARGAAEANEPERDGIYFVAWTTTPWTLPANLAIAVNPEVEYALVAYERDGRKRLGVAAAALVEKVFGRKSVEGHKVIATAAGAKLAGLTYKHPFADRSGKLVTADYVTTSDGSGLVHTAPGHGEDDYNTGLANGMEVYCPVTAEGRYDASVPEFIRGKGVFESNPIIIAKLRENHALLDEEKIRHSYPHDWRSKKPVIVRATEQWFIAMDKPYAAAGEKGEAKTLRARAVEALSEREGGTGAGEVGFVPEWGRHRFLGMVQNRPDWCISRQRTWGLPIPVFYNEAGEALLTGDSVRAVSRAFGKMGSGAWFTQGPEALLEGCDTGDGFEKSKLRKEKDIFDVWFESGSSWHAVLQARPEELKMPADLYLEGSDQHRGWFQLSLLPALAATGRPPFENVLTHGFVVKPDGTKVSKSDKEYVKAVDEVNRHGADVLRLWTCSVDYQNDIPTSPKTIQEFGDKYRKIRNTLRYLLSNLHDFDPQKDAVEAPFNSLDGWAWGQVDKLIEETTAAYEAYATHRAFRLIHDFCAVQLSAVYANAMKDRLYCEAPDSPLRRRSQTVMHRALWALVKLVAPILVFTADEAWEHVMGKGEEEGLASVHLARWPAVSGRSASEAEMEEQRLVMALRESALGQLDQLKKQVDLTKAGDAEAVYTVSGDELRQRLQKWGVDLADVVGAGHFSIEEGPAEAGAVQVKMVDRRQMYKACARSWKRSPDVGEDAEYPDLSLRDAAAMRAASRR